MLRRASLLAFALVPCMVGGLGRAAVAQEATEGSVAGEAQQAVPPEYGPPPGSAPETDPAPPPIPPNSEGAPFSVPGGGYCYYGPHPVDSRVSVGGPWDDTPGAHMHAYPPVDLRLFELRDGCYYFVGDPRDFGYAGPTFSYYGAHPILDEYGGGWCFMIGPHTHLWRPWSPHFALVGPWYYWEGPYDPFFWAYWPYYSFYYRSYYPHYYGGGRFPRGGYGVAPPIHRVPPPSHFAGSGAAGSPGWRGSPSGQPGNGWRGSPSAPRSSGASVPPAAPYRAATPAAPAAPYRAATPSAPAGRGWSGSPGGAARPAAPSFSAPAARSFGGGGFPRGGGGFSRGGGGRRR
jgi:hypothetical protein